MKKTINIRAALEFGWETLKTNFAFFIKLLVVLIVITIIPSVIIGKLGVSFGPVVGIPLQVLNLVWQANISMGLMKICLKLYDRQAVEFNDLCSCFPKTLDYVV